MSESTMKNIINQSFEIVKSGDIHFAFQGGEPTLIGIDYYYSFIEYVNNSKNNNVNISYSIQTNGFFIDDDWIKLFLDNNFLVGLSFDLLEDIHNKYRTKQNEGTYNIVSNAKKMFDKYNVQYNILTVLTSELSKYPDEVYKEIKKNNIKYIQFIPCLSELDFNQNNEYAISPEEFAYFYNKIFPMWEQDFYDDNYVSISFFDNVAELLSGFIPTTCGLNGKCHNHLVIESNGNVYPCDFYCIDKYYSGNINKDSIIDIINNQVKLDFVNDLKVMDGKCLNCIYNSLCNCGCKRMYNNVYIHNDFCGMKEFLDININSMIKILKNMNIIR